MINSQIRNIAIAYDEDENGLPIYQAHVFMAAPDYRVIQLDICRTQEAAQKSVEDFLEILAKVSQSQEQGGDIE